MYVYDWFLPNELFLPDTLNKSSSWVVPWFASRGGQLYITDTHRLFFRIMI